jgi:hypothetical protein
MYEVSENAPVLIAPASDLNDYHTRVTKRSIMFGD